MGILIELIHYPNFFLFCAKLHFFFLDLIFSMIPKLNYKKSYMEVSLSYRPYKEKILRGKTGSKSYTYRFIYFMG